MILRFNPRFSRAPLSSIGSFKGEIGLFFAVLEKLGKAPFLWWSEILTIKVNFESNQVLLEFGSIKNSIPFHNLLDLDYTGLVQKYMRPFAADLARSWNFHVTATVIESGGATDQIIEALRKEDPSVSEDEAIALTNILYTDAEVPWQNTLVLA
jgi:hypothetical protein